MTKDGGPAFPTTLDTYVDDGMSLRDWFAGMALQYCVREAWETPDKAAVWAYEFSDAMLAAREDK